MWNPGMNDTTGAGGFLNNSISADSPATKQKAGRRIQSILPLVIRQIRDSKGDEFKLFGTPAQIVTLVGIIREVEVQSTKATYKIEDHTGSMKMVWWLESDTNDDAPNLPPVREGGYVKVFGTIRTQNNEKNLMVLKLFPIDDCNVITTHLLEVIATRLQAEAAHKNKAQQIKHNNPGAQLAKSMDFFDESVSDGQVKFTPIQNRVFKIIQADQTMSGPDRNSILANFSANQTKDANDALDFLVNEGHAYSTIDSEHFKTTD